MNRFLILLAVILITYASAKLIKKQSMVEITFTGLVSLESVRKWPLYLFLCFSFTLSASFKQVFVFLV